MEKAIEIIPIISRKKSIKDKGRLQLPKYFRDILIEETPVVEMVLCQDNQHNNVLLIRKVKSTDK